MGWRIKIFGYVALVVALFSWCGSVYAVENPLLGQNHEYHLVFKNNGDAVVVARLIFTNNTDSQINQYSFSVPKASVKDLAIYEMKMTPICVDKQTNYDGSLPCNKSEEADMSDYRNNDEPMNYDGHPIGATEYHKIEPKIYGDKYSLDLPISVNKGQTAAIVVGYTSPSYTKKTLGSFNFNFETLKIDERISDAIINVDVDGDQLIRGEGTKVNYATKTASSSNGMVFGLSADAESNSINSAITSSFKSYSKPIIKAVSNLSANESATVHGQYASSLILLNLRSIIIAVLIVITALSFISLVTVRYNRRRSLTAPTGSVYDQQSATTSNQNLSGNLPIILSSFGAITLFFGVIYGSFKAYSALQDVSLAMIIPLIIGAAFICLVVLVVPTALVGLKYGWKAAFYTVLMMALWVAIYLGLYFAFFSGQNISAKSSRRVEYPISRPGSIIF